MSEDRVEAERRQIEQEIKGRTLCDLLAEHAAGHGDAPAMSWKRDGAWQTLSWREYRERVAEVAMGLAGLGVGKGDFVAIMATNRPEHVLADQGAVHAGATPTSFYFTLAPEQIQYVAGHCEAKVAVLEDRDMLKRWQDIRDDLPALQYLVVLDGAQDGDGPGVLGWDELVGRGRDALAADRSAFEELRGRVGPEDNATLLYTSGTTGPPKGVLLTHHNLLFECTALDRLTGLQPRGQLRLLPAPGPHRRAGALDLRAADHADPRLVLPRAHPGGRVRARGPADAVLRRAQGVGEGAGRHPGQAGRRGERAQAQDRPAGGGDRPRGRPAHPAGRAGAVRAPGPARRARAAGAGQGQAARSGWTAAASPPARPRPWPWTWPSSSPPSACPWSRCTA